MTKAITVKTVDHSSKEVFSFSFFCDKCGKEWVSESIAFTGAGGTVIENDEARQLLWAEEHRLAFEAANLEARVHFSLCPVCGKRVCNGCFDFEKDGCKDCKGD